EKPAAATAGSDRPAAATPETAAATAATPPPRRGVGAGGLVVAGLIGGVVGLAGALAATHYGVVPLPATPAAESADLAARVDALASAVAAAPASDPDAAAALRAAVADLGQR